MATTDTLVDRYGAPAPWRRRALIAASVTVAVVSGSWLGWTTWDHSTPDVQSELVNFEVLDEHAATADVRMQFRSPSVEATCLLRAFAEDHSVVGELSFTPSAAVNGMLTQTVRTERRATSVESIGCTADGQARPR